MGGAECQPGSVAAMQPAGQGEIGERDRALERVGQHGAGVVGAGSGDAAAFLVSSLIRVIRPLRIGSGLGIRVQSLNTIYKLR